MDGYKRSLMATGYNNDFDDIGDVADVVDVVDVVDVGDIGVVDVDVADIDHASCGEDTGRGLSALLGHLRQHFPSKDRSTTST